jgi:hypothetical protein
MAQATSHRGIEPAESAQHFPRLNDWEVFAVRNALWLKRRLS